MRHVSFDEIEDRLMQRLIISSAIHKSILESEDTTLEPSVFINYYLDFSTAIEFVIRQIMLFKYEDDCFIMDKIKLSKENFPTFLEVDDVEKLIIGNEPCLKWIDYKNFCKECCYDIKYNDFSNRSNNYIIKLEDFKTAYSQARNCRNMLAHGFHQKNLKFNKKNTLNFALAFYYLYEFYRSMCS